MADRRLQATLDREDPVDADLAANLSQTKRQQRRLLLWLVQGISQPWRPRETPVRLAHDRSIKLLVRLDPDNPVESGIIDELKRRGKGALRDALRAGFLGADQAMEVRDAPATTATTATNLPKIRSQTAVRKQTQKNTPADLGGMF